MSKALARLAERRRQLVAQAAAQRGMLTGDLEPWRARLSLIDQGVAGLRYVGSHPALMVGAALLFAVWRPRRFGLLLQRGWLVWQLGRSLRRHWVAGKSAT